MSRVNSTMSSIGCSPIEAAQPPGGFNLTDLLKPTLMGLPTESRLMILQWIWLLVGAEIFFAARNKTLEDVSRRQECLTDPSRKLEVFLTSPSTWHAYLTADAGQILKSRLLSCRQLSYETQLSFYRGNRWGVMVPSMFSADSLFRYMFRKTREGPSAKYKELITAVGVDLGKVIWSDPDRKIDVMLLSEVISTGLLGLQRLELTAERRDILMIDVSRPKRFYPQHFSYIHKCLLLAAALITKQHPTLKKGIWSADYEYVGDHGHYILRSWAKVNFFPAGEGSEPLARVVTPVHDVHGGIDDNGNAYKLQKEALAIKNLILDSPKIRGTDWKDVTPTWCYIATAGCLEGAVAAFSHKKAAVNSLRRICERRDVK